MLAALDATKDNPIASRFGVKGYPTVKYFSHGEFKFDVNVRDADKIVEFMKVRYRSSLVENYWFIKLMTCVSFRIHLSHHHLRPPKRLGRTNRRMLSTWTMNRLSRF